MAAVVPQQPIDCMAACLAAQVCVSFVLHVSRASNQEGQVCSALDISLMVRNRRLSEKRDLPQLVVQQLVSAVSLWFCQLAVDSWCLCVFMLCAVWPLPGQVNVADDDGWQPSKLVLQANLPQSDLGECAVECAILGASCGVELSCG
jgi:hypothetical protein